jgi:hypothetical protein
MFRTIKFRRSQNPSTSPSSQPQAITLNVPIMPKRTTASNLPENEKGWRKTSQSQESHTTAEPQPKPQEIVQPNPQLITSPPPPSLFSRPIPPLNPITLTSTPVHQAQTCSLPPNKGNLPKPTNPIASQSRALNPSCHALASPHPPIPSPATDRGHIDSSPQRCHSTSQLVSRRRLQWLPGLIPARNKPLDMHCPAFRVGCSQIGLDCRAAFAAGNFEWI